MKKVKDIKKTIDIEYVEFKTIKLHSAYDKVKRKIASQKYMASDKANFTKELLDIYLSSHPIVTIKNGKKRILISGVRTFQLSTTLVSQNEKVPIILCSRLNENEVLNYVSSDIISFYIFYSIKNAKDIYDNYNSFVEDDLIFRNIRQQLSIDKNKNIVNILRASRNTLLKK